MSSITVGSFAAEPIIENRQFNAGPAMGAVSGYDAINNRGRRKSIGAQNKSEDEILNPKNRAKLLGTGRDLVRNFSLAQWAIGQHLNYVTQFRFHATTPDKALNEVIQKAIAKRSKRKNFDIRRRHSRERFTRLVECSRVVDGDVGIMRLESGHVQAIESDRIRDPDLKKNPGKWVHGIKQDKAGADLAYAIHARISNRFEFERIVNASNLFLAGYHRRFDQTRGIGLIAPGLSPLRDVYEGVDHALARSKSDHIFAMVIKRAVEDTTGSMEGMDLTSGPKIVELNPGEEMSHVQSRQPSREFQEFMQMTIMFAIRALDIPYSFFSENFTNFFGSRAALMHYERACKDKRESLVEWLDEWTLWQITLAVLSDEIKLPRGFDLESLTWQWVPIGTPWWDPSKEIRGDVAAVGAGLADPYELALQRTGNTLEQNIDKTVQAIEYAAERGKSCGFKLSFDTSLVNPGAALAAPKVRKRKKKKVEN